MVPPAAQAATPNLSFGATTVFGAPNTQPMTAAVAPTFGVSSTIQPTPVQPAFGATNTAAQTLSFGAATAASTATGFGGFAAKPLGTTTLTFGAPTTSVAPLFGGSATSASTATVQPTLALAAAPIASVAPSTSFNFAAAAPNVQPIAGGLA